MECGLNSALPTVERTTVFLRYLSALCLDILNPVYTIQPVVKPVVQPVWQPVVSCKRGRSDLITRITYNKTPDFDDSPAPAVRTSVRCACRCRRKRDKTEILTHSHNRQPAIERVQALADISRSVL